MLLALLYLWKIFRQNILKEFWWKEIILYDVVVFCVTLQALAAQKDGLKLAFAILDNIQKIADFQVQAWVSGNLRSAWPNWLDRQKMWRVNIHGDVPEYVFMWRGETNKPSIFRIFSFAIRHQASPVCRGRGLKRNEGYCGCFCFCELRWLTVQGNFGYGYISVQRIIAFKDQFLDTQVRKCRQAHCVGSVFECAMKSLKLIIYKLCCWKQDLALPEGKMHGELTFAGCREPLHESTLTLAIGISSVITSAT